jgi:tRNA threonylcarbamoyladenosine biosynthesis protein TsaB
MIVLGIETSATVGSVALMDEGRVLAERTFTAGLVHGAELVPAIEQVAQEAGLAATGIDLIAVSRGPGSYTGLRVGVAAAKTLGYALGKPLIGVVSLDVIAANAPGQFGSVQVVVDARRRNVYVRRYERQAGEMRPCGPPEVATAADAAKRIQPGDAVLGDAIARYRDVFGPAPGWIGDEALWQPRAVEVCRLGLAEFRLRGGDGVHELMPLYMHRPEAEELWEKRHGEPGKGVGGD